MIYTKATKKVFTKLRKICKDLKSLKCINNTSNNNLGDLFVYTDSRWIHVFFYHEHIEYKMILSKYGRFVYKFDDRLKHPNARFHHHIDTENYPLRFNNYFFKICLIIHHYKL